MVLRLGACSIIRNLAAHFVRRGFVKRAQAVDNYLCQAGKGQRQNGLNDDSRANDDLRLKSRNPDP